MASLQIVSYGQGMDACRDARAGRKAPSPVDQETLTKCGRRRRSLDWSSEVSARIGPNRNVRASDYSSKLVGYVIKVAQGNPVCSPGFLEVSVP